MRLYLVIKTIREEEEEAKLKERGRKRNRPRGRDPKKKDIRYLIVYLPTKIIRIFALNICN